MKVLTINCGSSSVKYALFEMPGNQKLCDGIVHRVGLGGSFIEHIKLGTKYKHDQECSTHVAAVKLIIQFLTDPERGVVKRLSEIKLVGHRVVHGGEKYTKPVFTDGAVIKAIDGGYPVLEKRFTGHNWQT